MKNGVALGTPPAAKLSASKAAASESAAAEPAAAMRREGQAIWWNARAAEAGYSDGQALAAALDQPGYRLAQIYHAATKELKHAFEDITVLPTALRHKLSGLMQLSSVRLVREAASGDGQTTKFLFALRGSNQVETVLMRHQGARTTVCISSQAGCALRCDFCATGQGGFFRNLTCTEIFDQAVFAAARARSEGQILTNIVFMGMGEPFLNYSAVMDAVALLNDARGFNLGARRITISTAGIVPGIERFAAEHIQANLAISLHAAYDELRTRLMPINKKWPIQKLMTAVKAYVAATHRKIFYEYLLLAGVNDSPADARRLADLLGGPLHHVNLIPYNPTAAAYRRTPPAVAKRFQAVLRERGVPSTIRHTMGDDIAAACGQLRVDSERSAS